MTKLETIFSAVLLLIAAIPMADARAEGDGLPTIDLQKNCHNRTAAVAAEQDRSSTVAVCVEAEQKAQAALAAAWKDIPPAYKASCIKPNDFSPSYIEWIACLELRMDVKNLAKKP